jgi:hypothetical protein
MHVAVSKQRAIHRLMYLPGSDSRQNTCLGSIIVSWGCSRRARFDATLLLVILGSPLESGAVLPDVHGKSDDASGSRWALAGESAAGEPS